MTNLASHLVAHRGFPAFYPENSLAGMQAAIEVGALFIETDIQLSQQLTPFLCHDDHLLRLTGYNLKITELDDKKINTLTIAYPQSNNTTHITRLVEPFSPLSELCQLLAQHPQVTAFIEIKAESITRFGLHQTLNSILATIQSVHQQCILISFDHSIIAQARLQQTHRTGWVISQWIEAQRNIAIDLAPDYLFVSTTCLPQTAAELWPGPWQWTVYTVDDRATVQKYIDMGIALVETDTIGTLLSASANK